MQKILKSQFNDLCIAGLVLDMNSVSIYSGEFGSSGIDINPNGVHVQPGVGNAFIVSTYDRKGPLYKESVPPMDFLPGMSNTSARKSFDFTITSHAAGIAATGVAYSALIGALK